MNVSQLSDPELLHATSGAAGREKRATLELLEHLLEVDRRDLALREGHPSLWAYVHRGLGYSESAASERVAAMRLLKRAPEAREALRENKLTLTVAAQVQHFVRAVERTELRKVGAEETLQLVAEVEGKSKREVERMLVAKSPAAMAVRESVRQVSAETSELRIGMDAEMLALLADAKVLAGAANHTETIRRALKNFVAERRRELAPKRARPTRPAESAAVVAPATLPIATRRAAPSTPPPRASRYIPRETLRALWARAEQRCEFISDSGQRCGSQHRLQVDHRRPLAAGGTSDPSNLRVLCQAHNLAAARDWGLTPGSPRTGSRGADAHQLSRHNHADAHSNSSPRGVDLKPQPRGNPIKRSSPHSTH